MKVTTKAIVAVAAVPLLLALLSFLWPRTFPIGTRTLLRVVLPGLAAVAAVLAWLVHRLREREREFAEFVGALPVLAAKLAPDGTVLLRNEAAAREAGRGCPDAVGRRFWDLPHGNPERFREAVARAVALGEDRFEDPPRGPEGRSYDVTVRAVRREGEVAYLVATAHDLTGRKAMEARFLAADRMASVGVLAAGVAHEINNPLSYVIANLDVLADELRIHGGCLPEELQQELREAIEEAHEGAWRVRSIVKDLQTFSREDDQAAGPVDVHEALEKSLRMAGNLVRQRARLTKAYGAVPPVHANEARLGQVFLNLIVNGVQAMDEGHPAENELRIATYAADGRVVVEIADTGQGIPAANLPLIFQPFFTTKPLGQGTGLGLSICQNIVRALGGEIVVKSEVGRGTTFRVVLPVASGA